jgi:hypothetical protein
MFAPLILEVARYGVNCLKKQAFLHSAQLYRRERPYLLLFWTFFAPHDAAEPQFQEV